MRKLDLTNKKFGRLVAKTSSKNKNILGWDCECECGNKKWFPTFQLTNGNAKSCGCIHTTSLLGKKFGWLSVFGFDGYGVGDKPYWMCECECGNKISVYGKYLTGNKTTNCGCKTEELRSKANRLEYGVSSKNRVISYYKSNAKRKDLDFELIDEELEVLFQSNCYYCNIEPSNITSYDKNYGQYVYNGIDRKNNDIGYIKSNVVSCCTICNQLKKKYNEDEFLDKIRLIYENLIKNKEV